jgi:hypothetical protein
MRKKAPKKVIENLKDYRLEGALQRLLDEIARERSTNFTS